MTGYIRVVTLEEYVFHLFIRPSHLIILPIMLSVYCLVFRNGRGYSWLVCDVCSPVDWDVPMVRETEC